MRRGPGEWALGYRGRVEPEDWRIELVRSGGFAAIERRAGLASDELGPDEARDYEPLLEWVESHTATPAPPGGADRFQYDISIERAGRRSHVSVGEAELPRELRKLLQDVLARG